MKVATLLLVLGAIVAVASAENCFDALSKLVEPLSKLGPSTTKGTLDDLIGQTFRFQNICGNGITLKEKLEEFCDKLEHIDWKVTIVARDSAESLNYMFRKIADQVSDTKRRVCSEGNLAAFFARPEYKTQLVASSKSCYDAFLKLTKPLSELTTKSNEETLDNLIKLSKPVNLLCKSSYDLKDKLDEFCEKLEPLKDKAGIAVRDSEWLIRSKFNKIYDNLSKPHSEICVKVWKRDKQKAQAQVKAQAKAEVKAQEKAAQIAKNAQDAMLQKIQAETPERIAKGVTCYSAYLKLVEPLSKLTHSSNEATLDNLIKQSKQFQDTCESANLKSKLEEFCDKLEHTAWKTRITSRDSDEALKSKFINISNQVTGPFDQICSTANLDEFFARPEYKTQLVASAKNCYDAFSKLAKPLSELTTKSNEETLDNLIKLSKPVNLLCKSADDLKEKQKEFCEKLDPLHVKAGIAARDSEWLIRSKFIKISHNIYMPYTNICLLGKGTARRGLKSRILAKILAF